MRGAVGDAARLPELAGLKLTDIEATMAAEPASVQERWFARLYLLKPLVFAVFSLFWIATGLVSLGPGWEVGMSLMREGGASETVGAFAVIAGALADIAIGLAIAYRPTTRYGLYAALLISLSYAAIGTWLVPRLWSDPLGPMLKIWPIMALNLMALAIHEDR
jgi:polyferredoxin